MPSKESSEELWKWTLWKDYTWIKILLHQNKFFFLRKMIYLFIIHRERDKHTHTQREGGILLLLIHSQMSTAAELGQSNIVTAELKLVLDVRVFQDPVGNAMAWCIRICIDKKLEFEWIQDTTPGCGYLFSSSKCLLLNSSSNFNFSMDFSEASFYI